MKILKKLQRESQLFLSTTRKLPCCRFLTLAILVFLLSSTANSQSRWGNYVGVYFTGDAEMYYTGPSILLGSDFQVNKGLSVGLYSHYFEKKFGDHGFKTLSIAVLCQYNFGKKKNFYVASGLAYQRAIEEDFNHSDVINRSIVLPAFRIGYVISINKYALCPEICTTGPYISPGGSEIFTLPSVGLRIFRRIKPIRTMTK